MVDSKYLELFRQESDDLLERLEDALLNLESNPNQNEYIAAAFRAVHTLKGSGSMTGFDDLVTVAHEMESAFDLVRNGELAVSSELISLMLTAKDHLRREIDMTADVSTRTRLVEAVRAIVQQKSSGDGITEAASVDKQEFHLELNFAPEVLEAGSNLAAIFDDLRELGQLTLIPQFANIPSLEALSPKTLVLQWTGRLVTESSIEAVRDSFLFLADDSGIEVTLPASEERSSPPVVPVAPPPPAPILPETQTTADTIKVQVSKLNELVDLVGELVISKSRLSDIASRLEDTELVTVAEDMERLSNDLRDRIMDLRMLPMSATFRRFERLIRDLSVELGKSLRLETAGGDTELDKTVLERLSDPLVHLIRNAADHGIEMPAERRAAGKPEVGTVLLRAKQTESRVFIELQDDGRGINEDAVRKKAVERSLIDADAELTKPEVLDLIFEPGFSTAQRVSNVSGRGVGMDVVRRSIADLGGSLTLDSTPGEGTRFVVDLPLSLAIIDGLLVRVGDDPFLFPLSLVEECIEPPPAREGGAENRLIQVRDELVPYVSLREWFELPAERENEAQVVITNLGRGRFGFLVDRVVGQHQTVLKDLGPVGRNVGGLSGATILGDGTVALILDAGQIIRGLETDKVCA